MESDYCVFVVDDANVNRRILESALEKSYAVESFASGAACLERVNEKIPDLFLLDVDMPEMDGFTLCRRLKSLPGADNVPIMFVSALDDLDSRLAGYDAGGDDFITKPFSFPEVKKKIELLRRSGREKSSLRGQLDESAMLTSLVMSNLDEYSLLVRFLRTLNGCQQFREVADATLDLLRNFRLQGALQLRLPDEELTLDQNGRATPLESSIISHVRTLGSVVTFKTRAAFNFDRVTLLINNMPLENPDLCSRLRDHLAVAVESLEAKLEALQNRAESAVAQGEIAQILQALAAATQDFSDKYKTAHAQGSDTMHQLQNELRAEFVSLGMSEVQEDAIQAIIETRTDQLINHFDFSRETEKTLVELSGRLHQVLAASR